MPIKKMNMVLHGTPSANIWLGNSLASPHWVEGNRPKTFDFGVANPPFSNKAWRTGLDPENDVYHRFEYGIPPNKNGDYAFLLHILTSLKSTGKGAVVLPHGVLFRGNVEADIRRELVRRGYIKGIIGLPPNLFYGTGIPACILVLGKDATSCVSTGIFMIDASQGFMKDGNKNRLRHQDIRKIVDVFNAVETQNPASLPRYARMVSRAEIESNDYNLNLPRYIDTTEAEDVQDIAAHLQGGIPQRDIDDLARYWDVFPGLKTALLVPGDNGRATVETQNLASLRDHPEFAAYTETISAIFAHWRDAHRPRLMALATGDPPRALIETLSKALLQAFSVETQVETQDFASLQPLIDKYDVYQHLMAYWTETMQDDVYMIVEEGWLAANRLRLLEAKSKESAALKIGKRKYKADLIPPVLIIARYFSGEQEAIKALEAEQDALAQQVAELEEEHGGEEGLLEEARSDAGNVTKTAAKARLREIEGDPDVETQNLASHLVARVKVARVKELAERYATPLPQIAAEVETLSARVDALIAALERLIAKKRAIKQGAMQELLTGRIRLVGE